MNPNCGTTTTKGMGCWGARGAYLREEFRKEPVEALAHDGGEQGEEAGWSRNRANISTKKDPKKEQNAARRAAVLLPPTEVEIQGELYTALLDTGAIKSFFSDHRRNLATKEAFTCSDGRRVKVARQARGVNQGVKGRRFRMDLHIAERTQETLLGYDFLH